MLTLESKGRIKSVLGRMLFTLRLHQIGGLERGVVVSFHRVNREADPTGLTISPEMFERFCRFFSHYFDVVSLTHFVERLEKGQSVGALLAITFDDGYLDNFEIAAPILKRLNLPATFFVTTKFVGTDTVPMWDQEAGVSFPWMSWEQVGSLHKQGFEIGAHTRHHVDLGKTAGDLAREEIHGSRADLEDKLGTAVRLFAYPFGRANQMTGPNRELVTIGGFRCCCSCFGGTNTASTDPFLLRRVPISTWFTSPFHFAFEFATKAFDLEEGIRHQ